MLQESWNITLGLAPWLLLGTAIAGILHVLLPPGLIHRQLRGRWGVLKAVVLGVPLPLCSCGVIPAGIGLKKDGASDGAAVGFLISTPQTGIDSILVSASFLGWPFALFKVGSAALTGLVGGVLADAVATPSTDQLEQAADRTTGRRGLRELLEHSRKILESIWHWIVIGVVVSAAITVYVPESVFAELSRMGTLVPVLAALVISLPLYVCATASVPIAAALVAGGMPTGAALVFLMAGPATNVATIGAIYRALGGRTLVVYLATIVLGSVGLGIAFDFVLDETTTGAVHTHHDAGPFAVVAAVLLLTLLAWFAIADVRRLVARRTFGAVAEATVQVGVDGMNCGQCVLKLENALKHEAGVTGVLVTLNPGRVVVRGTIAEPRVRDIIENTGFSPGSAGS